MLIPDEKINNSPVYGTVTSVKSFKVQIRDVDIVKYSLFRKKYHSIIKGDSYIVDEETMTVYFYVPEEKIIGLKGQLQIAKLKKEFKEYLV